MLRTKKRGRVLVLDADLPPALSVVRSLARLGLCLDVAASSPQPISGYSRHVERVLDYPDPLGDCDGFLDWLEQVTTLGKYQLVIPVSERTLVPIASQYGRFSCAKVAMAPPAALEVALDKERTLSLASSLGISVPRSVTVRTVGELGKATSGFEFPLVVKPGRSVGNAADHRVVLSVCYARTEEELYGRVRALLEHGPVILQECFVGDGVGVELIAEHGEVVYAFQHLRLHEVPLTGGGSTFRKSVPVNPSLLSASRALMSALQWHGVAMVEFKVDPASGEYRLMEINGRLWGSLPLAVAAGADFPAMLYRLHVQGSVGPTLPPRSGVYCRKLSTDLFWLELVARSRDANPIAPVPSLSGGLRDLLLVFSFSHHFDVQQLSDPVPGLVDLKRLLSTYLRRVTGSVVDRMALWRHARSWSSGEVARRLRGAGCILFVCYGNINRSILAQRYLQKLLPGMAGRVCSAGFHEHDGRPADPTMTEVAGRHGVDLSSTASTHLDLDLLSAADVIFVMDLSQLRRIARVDGDAVSRTFLLGMADRDLAGGVEIDDPYGRPRDVYERCFERVTRSVNSLSKMLCVDAEVSGDAVS